MVVHGYLHCYTKLGFSTPKCRTAHLAKLNRRPLNSDQADKMLRSFIIIDTSKKTASTALPVLSFYLSSDQ